MLAIKEHVDAFAAELKNADRDAYIQWATLTYQISNDADPALFYIETGKIDIEVVKRKVLDVTKAEEVELYPDYSMEVINPKLYLEKLDVDISVYHADKEKEPVVVPLVLSEYCINFTDYRDGIGGYLNTDFADNKTVTGWVDSGNAKKVDSLKKLLEEFGATRILD